MPIRGHSPSKVARQSVALLIESSNRYSRELLHGIRSYMHDHGSWAVHLTEHGRGDLPPLWLKTWQGDGILARIENQTVERAVLAAGVPVVNVSASGLAPGVPTVISDSSAVAQLAAEHLIERGFSHFAYCGDVRFAWSAKHGDNFVRHLKRAGHTCAVFDSDRDDFADWEEERRKLAQWIQSLPKPAGIMACYDIRGQQLLDVCRHLGLQVPDEIAVIGQHDDDLLCDLCDPPLSSVIPNARSAGYEAAALLDRLMRGLRVPSRVINIAPVGVATRQSTDVIALKDQQVSAAVRFIRENACRGIGVEDVLRAVPMSRTLLERKFQQALHRTPYEEIMLARFRRAQALLAASDLSISEIAERAGFSSAEYLSAAFKKHQGANPRAFRAKHRAGAVEWPSREYPPRAKRE